MAVEHHPTTEEQDQRETDLGKVLNPGGPLSSKLRVLHVGPGHAFGGVGESVDLGFLLGEGLDDAHAVYVLVDDGGDVGETRLGDPRNREERSSHADPDEVHRWHDGQSDERKPRVNAEHEGERNDADGALHHDEWRKRRIHLHASDIAVGAAD